ncbi:hypothetical protein ACLOJK_033270 [Asimina triloba]
MKSWEVYSQELYVRDCTAITIDCTAVRMSAPFPVYIRLMLLDSTQLIYSKAKPTIPASRFGLRRSCSILIMEAATLSISRSLFITVFLLLSVVVVSISAEPLKFKLGEEKMTHLHFYFHDIVSGPNPTAVRVVAPPSATSTFGAVAIIDDPLTEGPDPKSKLIGRAQGLYALASQEEFGLLMVLNYVFVEGKYNGSTLSILGRNAILNKVREMPVLGGSGLFRFARGYAQARTHFFNMTSGDAIVEYNVYVIHY